MSGRVDSSNRRLAANAADPSGQAAVEFVLVLPLLLTLLFLIFELGIVLLHALTVNDAAGALARAASVYRFNGQLTACDAANAAAPTAAGGLVVSVSCAGGDNPGDQFTVTVSYPWSIKLPLLPLSTGGQLTSSATEKVE